MKNRVNTFIDLYKINIIGLLSFLIVFFIACFTLLIDHEDINRDAVLYLKQAFLFSEDTEKALIFYQLPLYSFLIYTVNEITGLLFHHSARILNLFLFGIATYFYLKIIFMIYKSSRTVFFGALLLSIFAPLMDIYIEMIIKDYGFWATSLAGLFYLLKSFNGSKNLFYLSIFIFLLGSLFRIESLLFVVSSIFIFFISNIYKSKDTLISFITNRLFLFLCLVFIIIFCLFFKTNYFYDQSFTSNLNLKMNSFLDAPFRILVDFSKNDGFKDVSDLNKILSKYQMILSFFVIFLVSAFKWFKGFGFFNLILFYRKINNKVDFNFDEKIIIFFTSLNFVYVFVHFFTSLTISSRYFLVGWLFLLIILSPELESFYYKFKSFIWKSFFTIFIFIYLTLMVSDNKNVHIDRVVANYLIDNKFTNTTYINSDRINYYVNKDASLLWDFDIEDIEYKNVDSLYLLLNTHCNSYSYSNGCIPINFDNFNEIKRFPESNSQFVLYKKDSNK